MENKLIVSNMDDVKRASVAMAKSQYFQDAQEVEKAAVKVMAGYEMGFGPFASMTGIHIIKGKPAIGSNLIAAAIKRHPLYNYKVVPPHNDKVCKIEFYENWGGSWEMVGVSEFTIQDAKTAGLTSNPTWSKYPKNMLFSRAISNGAKFYCPDVFGGSPTYTPEELGAQVDEDENVITGEVIEEKTEDDYLVDLGFEPNQKNAQKHAQNEQTHATTHAAPQNQNLNGKVDAVEQSSTDVQNENSTSDKLTALKDQIIAKVAKLGDYSASDKQRQLARHLLDNTIFMDNTGAKRHQVLYWLFGNESTSANGGISGAQIKVLLDWLNPEKDSGGAYVVPESRVRACNEIARQEQVDKGQMVIEFEESVTA